MYNCRSSWCWYLGIGSGMISIMAPFGSTLVNFSCSIGVGEPYMISTMLMLTTMTLLLRKSFFENISLKLEVLVQPISYCTLYPHPLLEFLKCWIIPYFTSRCLKKNNINVWYKSIGIIIIVQERYVPKTGK